MSERCTRRGLPSLSPDAPLASRLRRFALSAAVVVCLVVHPLRSDERRLIFEGLADGELWETDSQSLLLSRNEGETATQRRLRLWAAAQFTEGFQGMILGRFEGGDSSEYIGTDEKSGELEQVWLRYTLPTSVRLVLQAGQVPQPLGSFSRRYLSNQNPLIGAPATYDMVYPYAIELTGRVGRFDFLAAVVDKPLGRQIWLSEADSVPRPAIAVGFTPVTGFRFGTYATWGSYLSRDDEPYIPAGHRWRDYSQRVIGFDLQYSRGHFELNGEMTRSLFEVPGESDESGVVGYLEPKYTWSPRWYTALRLERNQQTSVWLPWGASWYVTDENSWDLEAGAGFRIDPRSLVKLSYRVERSTEYPTYTPELSHALALQLSWNFDAISWFDRPR